jgi:hypothetical protein
VADLNRLKLVDARNFDGRELTVTIARTELHRALDSGADAELVLSVARAEGPDAEVEAHTLSVALDRQDLEELLRADEGEEIGLLFDAEDVEAALAEDEVEAHGLRERAAVLAVVATGAAGLAGQAAAQPTTDVAGKAVPAARGMTAEQIWATAPAAVKRAYAKQDAARAARLETPAPLHPSSGGGGFELSAPSPAEAALAGEVALLITGVGLAMRGHRRRPAKPA